MKSKKLINTYNIIGFAIIIFLTLRESLSLVLMHTPLQKGSVPFLLLSMLVFALACFVPVTVMENMLGVHPLLFKKVKPNDAAAAAAAGYLIILAAGVVNSILMMPLKSAGISFAPVQLNIPQGVFNGILYFIYLCVMPAVLEEIFVRGLVLNALKPWGVSFAVGLSSLIFALMHSALHNVFLYFVCGIVLAKIYLAFDSLLPCMLLHFVNNTLAFLLSAFQQRANAVSAVSFSVYVYILAIVLGIAGARYLKRRGISFAFGYKRSQDTKLKFTCMFKGGVGLTALCLLVFIAAYNSYRLLI